MFYFLFGMEEIQKVLVYCNAVKFGLCSPTFWQCCLPQGGMFNISFPVITLKQVTKHFFYNMKYICCKMSFKIGTWCIKLNV